MAVLILITLLLRAESVLSDIQCDCNSLTFIKDLLQQEIFERKLENTRIWSKISTGTGLIETSSFKGSDSSKRVDRLEEQSVQKEEAETFQTVVQKALRDEKVERINFLSQVLSQIEESKETVSDLKDKFEKHVDESTKRFHSAAKKFGTCRGMKGYETKWKENWKLHESKCFRFFENKKNWLDASESCKKHNADLVEIESKEENDFIMLNVNLTGDSMWIGLNDRDEESVWKWHSTKNTLRSGHFSNWAPTEPNDDQANEDCATILTNGQWNDYICDEGQGFVCQKDPEL